MCDMYIYIYMLHADVFAQVHNCLFHKEVRKGPLFLLRIRSEKWSLCCLMGWTLSVWADQLGSEGFAGEAIISA